jgi:hypothetical protein
VTTKKLVIIIVSVVISIGVLVAIIVGGIVGLAYYQWGNSEAATAAKKFLRDNEKLKQDIGEVKDFGSLVSGSINVSNGDGQEILSLKVIGERKTVRANVELMYRSGREWRVTGASYTNEVGKTVDLLNPYESNLRFRISNLRSQISNLRSQISNLRSQISNLKFSDSEITQTPPLKTAA